MGDLLRLQKRDRPTNGVSGGALSRSRHIGPLDELSTLWVAANQGWRSPRDSHAPVSRGFERRSYPLAEGVHQFAEVAVLRGHVSSWAGPTCGASTIRRVVAHSGADAEACVDRALTEWSVRYCTLRAATPMPARYSASSVVSKTSAIVVAIAARSIQRFTISGGCGSFAARGGVVRGALRACDAG